METTSSGGKGPLDGGSFVSSAISPVISQGVLKLRAALRARAGSRIAAPPTLVTMELTSPGPDSLQPAAGRTVLGRFFKGLGFPSRSDWLNAVDAVPSGAALRLAGGEPLASPHLEAVLFHADSRGLDIEIVTTGALLAQHAPVIYGLGVAKVRLILFGSEEAHNRALGSSNAFEQAVRGALALKGLRYGTTRPLVLVHLITLADRVGWVAAMVDCALAMGADQVVVHYPTPRAGVAASPPRSDGQAVPAANDVSFRDLIEELNHVRKQRRGAVRFFPPLGANEARDFCLGKPVSARGRRCFVPWRSITVGPDGLSRFCVDEPIGDIRQDSLSDIYNGEPAGAFRRRIRTALLPQCAGCARRFGDEDFGK